MKYVISACLLLAVAAFSACSGGDKKKDDPAPGNATPAPTAAQDGDLSADPVYAEGLALVKKSDCLTCHNEARKIVGPMYQEVAAKYENTPANITMLAERIIKGGAGVWGEQQMTAHPTLSQEDAEKMVKYVFKLKK